MHTPKAQKFGQFRSTTSCFQYIIQRSRKLKQFRQVLLKVHCIHSVLTTDTPILVRFTLQEAVFEMSGCRNRKTVMGNAPNDHKDTLTYYRSKIM